MRIHIVKEGDTLYFLSKKYNVSLEKIISANPEITDPNQLSIGMKVKIPSAPVTTHPGESILHQHKVVQGDSLWKLSKAWGVSLQDMIAANPQLKNPNALMVGETVFIPSGSSSTPHTTATENVKEGTPTPAAGSQEHTGKKNTASMPNYPQLPELPEMPEMPVLPKAEITQPILPKAEMTKPKPISPKEEITKPKPEPPKQEGKKIEPAPKPIPLQVPKPEMIKPIPLPAPLPPMKKTEYEPKKEEYYSKKEDCNNEYMKPYQNPVYDKGMYGGNAGYQGYQGHQKPYQQQPMGYLNDKKQGYPQPMPYVQQQYSGQNMPYQSEKSGDMSQQPYTTHEHGGYIVNYALVDVPSYGGDCGCGHAKPLPYSYMQVEADWKAATAQNAQPMLHPQAYGHNPQYTNYFRPTEYGVQAPYYNPNYQNGYEQPSFQTETAQPSSQTGAELEQQPIADLNGLNQLPILEEEKTIQKNKTVSKSNKVKKAAVSSNKRNKAPSNNGRGTRQGGARKERKNPWIKR